MRQESKNLNDMIWQRLYWPLLALKMVVISAMQDAFRMWKRQGNGFPPTAPRKKCSHDINLTFMYKFLWTYVFIFHEYSSSSTNVRSYDNSVYHLENLSNCFPKWIVPFIFIYIIHTFTWYIHLYVSNVWGLQFLHNVKNTCYYLTSYL